MNRILPTALIVSAILLPSEKEGTSHVTATSPVPISCGGVLNQDAYLATDLTCLHGGITVDATIAIDLRGHVLTGPKDSTDQTSDSTVGIHVLKSNSLKLTHGRIAGFGTGLLADGGAQNASTSDIVVSAVTFTDNTVGLGSVETRTGNNVAFTVGQSLFLKNASGILGNTIGHPATIIGSWFESNGQAIDVAATPLTVKRTRFYRDTEGVTCRAATCTIDDNAFIEGGGYSLDILLATLGEPGPRGSDSISGNIFNGNHSGRAAIEVEGDGEGFLLPGPIFEQNMIVDNDAGINVLEASATLSANTFIRNGSAFSATTDANDPSEVSLYDNIVTLNTDGIQIDEASQLRGNLVTFNDGFGIRAAGSSDLGGNRAYGNRKAPQCEGVVCS